jgi:surface antigen
MSRREARAARESAGAQLPAPPPAVVHSGVALAGTIASGVVRPSSAGVSPPRTVASPKRARRNPVRAFASMAVIGGLFVVAGLPAYGQSSLLTDDGSVVASAAVEESSTVSAQSLTVSADLELPKLERDTFEATSPEDLEQIRQQAAFVAENAIYAASGARALGDDYPWATAGYSLSPLNYYYRQCTDFVAWRLNRDVGSYAAPFRWQWSDLTPNGGDASQWKAAWNAHGWTVSAKPVVGSVAWFGWDNHVAYVKAVNDNGTVLIEEYNYVNRVYSQRTLAPSDVEAFLYPPGQ